MREEEDEVVVYLVVVGTVESVDRQFYNGPGRIHYGIFITRFLVLHLCSNGYLILLTQLEFMKLTRACEAVRSFVPTSLPPHRTTLHLGLWLRILTWPGF